MGMGGMGGMGGYVGGGRGFYAQVADPIPRADDVAELIRELLPDPSWKEEGVLLKPFHDVLIIRQRGPMRHCCQARNSAACRRLSQWI